MSELQDLQWTINQIKRGPHASEHTKVTVNPELIDKTVRL